MPTYKSIRYIVPDEAVEHTDSINALADVDTSTVAPEVGQTLKWSATNSKWQPADIAEEEDATYTPNEKAIFAFGNGPGSPGYTTKSNLVSNTGVVATDVSGVGTARDKLAAANYGGDKAVFAFGQNNFSGSGGMINISNLVSNQGVIATDTTGVGTSRMELAATGYGGDKALFGYGYHSSGLTGQSQSFNLVSNTGVIANDANAAGMRRSRLAAVRYGTDTAVFAFGWDDDDWYGVGYTNVSNLVSNTGIVASDTTTAGTIKCRLAACTYGEDKAVFSFGHVDDNGYYAATNQNNYVSNTGVIAADSNGLATSRRWLAAAGYGGDKGIFAYGGAEDDTNEKNLVSSTGVVSANQTGVGTARFRLAAAGYAL